MKMLILGGRGMAGHMITSYFTREHPDYQLFFTSRNPQDRNATYLDATDSRAVEKLFEELRPDVVINCIGILNEQASSDMKLAFQLNSLLPHQLAKLAERTNGKLIHISTDCVFLGKKGSYTESDLPDGTSAYAQSKQLGEIIDDRHLTIRTSIIGPELKDNGIGLFLWFMKQKGQIKGYEKALWNGVTTLELAKAIDAMLKAQVTGLYHLGVKKKISKANLLRLMQRIFEKNDVEIISDHEVMLDRTIQSTRKDFSYEVPDYETMLLELKNWMESS
ncbi:dTDP-4-dehydrorhamnose reductase family protein [Bacillus rubiinfantis]|uniref:dTDP-4-dehydrorhamnose reductase family protein n=1 Tax=Bacillus rubiinfantis TaxID=1499680 RepID=UPI0005AB0CEF|nr:SDR family oxidoreductase [Bacillus rubiinfantis]